MLARFDGLILHLHAAALAKIKMTFQSGGACATRPAELVFAKTTGHMVAALVFLDVSVAHWTERDIFSILFKPALKVPT